jgi:hypothetical protein
MSRGTEQGRVGEWRLDGWASECGACDHPLLCVTPSPRHSFSVRRVMGLGRRLAMSRGRMTCLEEEGKQTEEQREGGHG